MGEGGMNEVLKAIDCALCVLPDPMDTPEARVMLLAIGFQESRFKHRRQLVGNPPRPTGPAKSFWQAEQAGGMVRGLLNYQDRKSTRLNSSHVKISYAVFCLKKKKHINY